MMQIKPKKQHVETMLILSLLTVLAIVPVYAEETAAVAPSAPTMLPDSTILSVQLGPWSAYTNGFDKTALAKIFNEPEVKSFLSGPLGRLHALMSSPDAVKPNDAQATEMGSIFKSLGDVVPGPVIVALSYSDEDIQAKRPPAAAFILGAQEAPEFVKAALQYFAQKFVKTQPYAGAQLMIIQGEKTTPTFTTYKNQVIITTQTELAQKIIDGLSGQLGDKRLADKPSFKTLGISGNEAMGAYLDVATLRKALEGADKQGKGNVKVREFLDRAGLTNIGSIAWSMRINGDGFESRASMTATGPRDGFLGTLDSEPLSKDGFKVCPPNSPFAAAVRLKEGQVADALLGILASGYSQAGSTLATRGEALEKKYAEKTQHVLKADLVANFGNELVMGSFAGAENVPSLNPARTLVAGVPVKDAAKADAFFVDLMKVLAELQNPGAKVEEQVQELPFENSKLRYVKGAVGTTDVDLKVAVVGGHAILATEILALKGAVHVYQNQNLTGTQAFKDALDHADGKLGSAVAYMDWAWFYGAAFNFSVGALEILPFKDALKKAGVDVALLPSPQSVQKHLFPSLTVVQASDNALTLTSRGPLPSLEVMAPPIAAFAAVIANFSADLGWGVKEEKK